MYHVKGVVLKKLLEYLYCGEVQVEKKYLPEFIMLGQSLKVKGLVNRTEDTSKQSTENDQMKFKRKKLEEYILTKNKKSKGDAGENDELTLPDEEDASTDEEPEQDKPKQESLEEKTENPLESADSSIILAKPGAPDEDEDQLTSHFHRAVTKSYTRYQRLVANIRKTESGPHEMTKGTRRRCGQCSIQKLEKRTSYYCRTCNIALCRECFEPFHKTFDGGDGSKGAA
ncbi:uncharacterized protein LOC119661191 isoform X2 [Hermetia illucens]|nr:uncharacterized protein LOC119661191 isoform X2 [Hermetia illucens]